MCNMGKIDKITTREEIIEYASKPFVIFERSQPNYIGAGGFSNWEDYYNSLDAKYISSELSSGVIATKTSAGWGYISEEPRWLIEPMYEDVTDFNNRNKVIVIW